MRNRTSRRLAFGLCLALAASGFARADEPARIDPTPEAATPAEPQSACLNDRELRRLVEAGTVVPPIEAIRAARADAGGDAVGARLCRDGEDHVYRVTLLTKDGRIIRVAVNGRTGRVAERR
jgi:hypothetical protein